MVKSLKQVFLLVLTGVSGLVLTGCGTTDIDLNDYLTIEYDGYDGFGHGLASIDFEQLASDYADNINDDEVSNGLTNQEFLLAVMRGSVEVDMDNDRELSNGDDVFVEWLVREQEVIEETLGVSFTYEDVSEEVSDLIAVETFDAFENVTVAFSGVSPSGSASLNVGESPIPEHSYGVEDGYDLSNGDTVLVSINENAITELAASDGLVPMETEKTFVVDGLSEYVTKLSDIDDDAFEAMNKQGQDAIMAYVAQEWDNVDTYDSATPIGHYLLTPKDSNLVSEYNRIVLAYQINTTKNFAFNSYIEFHDLLRLEDGSISFDISRYNTPDRWTGFRHDDLYYHGYESLGELFNDKVARYVDVYNYETNID